MISNEEKRILREAEKERKLLERAEREEQRRIKAEQKAVAKVEKEKPEPTEEELVHKYVNRVMKNQEYHGRIDNKRFDGFNTQEANKNLWLDTDFYFSVVFQSRRQKYEFLEKWDQFLESWYEEDLSGSQQINIINGVELAKGMGIDLQLETRKDYPTSNIDLLPLILDNEISDIGSEQKE